MEDVFSNHIIPLTLMIRWEILYENLTYLKEFNDILTKTEKDLLWLNDLGYRHVELINKNMFL